MMKAISSTKNWQCPANVSFREFKWKTGALSASSRVKFLFSLWQTKAKRGNHFLPGIYHKVEMPTHSLVQGIYLNVYMSARIIAIFIFEYILKAWNVYYLRRRISTESVSGMLYFSRRKAVSPKSFHYISTIDRFWKMNRIIRLSRLRSSENESFNL